VTAQEAYVAINELLEKAQGYKTTVDDIISEARKLARKHDLVFEQRYLDALPEVLDPSLYEEVMEEEAEYGYGAEGRYGKIGTKMVKVKRFKDNLPKAFTRENYIEPGDTVEAWIPSSLC
jgi:hypothetical protein